MQTYQTYAEFMVLEGFFLLKIGLAWRKNSLSLTRAKNTMTEIKIQ